MKKNISFKQLAKISNVSIGTLSRYFNNGPVSAKNKEIIKQNIKKFNYVKNAAASAIHQQPKTTIIVRTFIHSKTQDNIITGIIETLKNNDIIVKYSLPSETEVIKSLQWAAEQKPKYLIVFAPINPSKNFQKFLLFLKSNCQVAVFNYHHLTINSVIIDWEIAIKSLSQKYQSINFIYDNQKDQSSFLKRYQLLKKHFNKVILAKDNIQYNSQDLYIFQTENLRQKNLEKLWNKNIKIKNVALTYQKPLFFDELVEWIFVDHFLIGYQLVKSLKNKATISYDVKAKLINKTP